MKTTIQRTKVLVMQLEIPLDVVIHAIDIAYASGITILLNPAPATQIPIETLRKVTFLIPNESELALLSGFEINNFSDCRKAVSQLQSLGLIKSSSHAKSMALTISIRIIKSSHLLLPCPS